MGDTVVGVDLNMSGESRALARFISSFAGRSADIINRAAWRHGLYLEGLERHIRHLAVEARLAI